MSHNNGIISAPVDVEGDIATVLVRSTGDVGLLCGDMKYNTLGQLVDANAINRWAFWKPVRYNKLAPLTRAERASVKDGMHPIALTKLLQMSIGYAGGTTYTLDQCMQEVSEWTYNKPRGKTTYNEWYRVLDFAYYNDQTGSLYGNGYNHNAVAPDTGWASKDLDDTDLTAMIATTQTVSGSGGDFSIVPSNTNYLYQNFSMLFGSGSGEQWGTCTNMEIPISYITALEDKWRLAIAVWVPNPVSGNYAWHYFIGRHIIKDYTDGVVNMGQIMPDFASNQVAAYYMKSYIDTNGYTEFQAVPVLVYDIRFEYQTINDVQRFQPKVVNDATLVYCMPSGASTMTVNCGTPTIPHYWSKRKTRGYVGGIYTETVYLKNTDENNPHTYTYVIYHNGVVYSTVTNRQIAANTEVVAATWQLSSSADSCDINVTAQDGQPV